MKLHHLSLHNFCQHHHVELDFQQGLIGLIGPNGRGKSNLLGALHLLLTGKTADGRALESTIRWGMDSTKLELTFEFRDGAEGKITRVLGANSSFELELGEESRTALTEGYKLFLNSLNASPQMLSTVAFLQQDQLGRFLFGTPAERSQAFQRLFQTEHAEKSRRLLQEEISLVPRIDSSEELRQALETFNALSDLESDVSSEVAELEQELSPESNLSQLLASGGEERKKQEALLLKKSWMEETLSQLNESLDFSRSFSHEDFEQMKTAVASARDTIATFQNQAPLRLRRKELQASQVSLSDTLERTREFLEKHNLAQASKRLSDSTKHLSHLDLREHSLTALLASLGRPGELPERESCPICGYLPEATPGRCPICLSTLKIEDADNLELEREELSTRCSEAREMVQSAKKDAALIQKTLEIYEQSSERFLLIEHELAVIGSLVEVTDALAAEGTLKDLEPQLEPINQARAQVDSTKKQLENRTRELEEVNQALAAIDCNLIQQYHRAIEKTQVLREDLAGKKGEQRGLARQIEFQLAAIARLKAAVKCEEKRALYISKLESARALLHRDNIPAQAAREHLPIINRFLSEYLRVFDAGFEGWIDTDLSPVVAFASSAETQPALVLSGGERTIMSLSFAFSVWSQFLPEVGFLFLDEPTQFLDEKNRGMLPDLLSKLGQYCRESGTQVIIVTHYGELLSSSFDQCIRME